MQRGQKQTAKENFLICSCRTGVLIEENKFIGVAQYISDILVKADSSLWSPH